MAKLYYPHVYGERYVYGHVDPVGPLYKPFVPCYHNTDMTASPRLTKKQPSQTTAQYRRLSAPMLLFVTALDTTWRVFIPTLAGTFLGIGIDSWLASAPVATIVCLALGVTASALLIAQQLLAIRKVSPK